MTNFDNEEVVLDKEKVQDEHKHPNLYHLVLFNDDYTHFEFVIKILNEIFDMSIEEAFLCTIAIQMKGEGVVGTYTKDETEKRGDLIESYKEEYDQPLMWDIRRA